MKGTCGICEVEVDGVMTTACTAKLARGRDIVVEYKDVKEMQQYAKEIAMRDSRLRKQMKTGKAPPRPKAEGDGRVQPTKLGGFSPPALPKMDLPKLDLAPPKLELPNPFASAPAPEPKKVGWPFG